MNDQLQVGTCDLCGQEMVYTPADNDAWHPWYVKRACPPEPPSLSAEWGNWYQAGNRPGRPGAQHFVRNTDANG